MNSFISMSLLAGLCLLLCVQAQLQMDQGGSSGGQFGASKFQGGNAREREGRQQGRLGQGGEDTGEYKAEIYYDPEYYGYESKIPGGKAKFKAYRANPQSGGYDQDSFRGPKGRSLDSSSSSGRSSFSSAGQSSNF